MKKSIIPPSSDFIVVDTEGKEILRQIAIIDTTGKVIYEAFAKEHPDNDPHHLYVKPLKEILQDFLVLRG